jgi:plasmid maintenance system antidote protein VapI
MTLHAREKDHLGAMLDRQYFLPRNLSIYRVAKDTGISPKILCGTLTGRMRLPIKDGLVLARYFGEEEGFFARMQLEYDLRIEKQGLEKDDCYSGRN